MLRKKRGVVGSAKSRSPLDQPPRTPFLLQQQGASRMSIANTIMEGQLPMNSFQDELERHAVQNQFAGSLFPQQTEVMQVDGALKRSRLVLADFAFTGNMTGLVDGFIDIGKDTWERQLHNEIGKVERSIMANTDFKNFLEHDFAFSNVSPAIDLMTTMMGSEAVPAPTLEEVATLSARIRAHDPTLLTDTRALIKILKSPDLWSVLYDETKKYLVGQGVNYVKTTAVASIMTFLTYLIAQLRRVGKDYGLPIPPWFDSPPGGGGGGGAGGGPGSGGPGGGTPPADPTAPPSMQRGDGTDQADPTLETTPTPPTGTASSANVPPTTLTPPTPPSAPTVQPPTTPNTGMGLRYHPRTQGGAAATPPPPPAIPNNAPSPFQGDTPAPQYTSFYMVALQYALVASAGAYGAMRMARRPPEIVPPGGMIEDAIEGGAQHGLGGLARYLVINFAPQFFNSNLARYIIENIRLGDRFFMNVRFSEWMRTLFQQAIVNGQAGEPMFPDPGEIPEAQIAPREAAQEFLGYLVGLSVQDQAVVDAVRNYLDSVVSNVVAEQQPPYTVESGGQTVGSGMKENPDTQASEASTRETTSVGSVLATQVIDNIDRFSTNYVSNGRITTSIGLSTALTLLADQVMRLRGVDASAAVRSAIVNGAGTVTQLRNAIDVLREYMSRNDDRLRDIDNEYALSRPRAKIVPFLTQILGALNRRATPP